MGYMRVDQNRDPQKPDKGYWSGTANGLLIRPRTRRHPDWEIGGETLRWFLYARASEFCEARGVALIGHSHGGQVIAYALAEAERKYLPDPLCVITVDMPVRRDMERIYCLARKHVSHWIHLWNDNCIRCIGSWYGPKKLEIADRNMEIQGGHRGILNSPKHLDQWDDILDQFKCDCRSAKYSPVKRPVQNLAGADSSTR